MLVLRKEIKMGAAIGLTVLGIAGVYGLMASLSSDHGQQTANTESAADGDQQSRTSAVTDALRNKDVDIKPTPAPAPVVPKAVTPKGDADPFAETNRTDGNLNGDVLLRALSTGSLADDKSKIVKTAIDEPLVTPAPVPTAKRSPLVMETDPATADEAVKPAAKKASILADAPVASAETAGPDGKYTVAAGDTFSTIAAKVYGNKKYYAALVKANPDVNPSRLKIGRQINVPAKAGMAASSLSSRGAIVAETATVTGTIDASHQYRVAPGDTLSRIANKLYGRSALWESIYEANKTAIGADPGRLKLGQVLDLPRTPTR